MVGEPLFILLVEDNDDHAELIMRSFEIHRIANKLVRVSDGEEALNYLFNKEPFADKNQYSKPNLILLDLRMPKVDGLEVLKEIKQHENLKKIPVVILTSSEAEIDIAKAYNNYVNSYLVKPLDFNKFSNLMNELGFYWLSWNTNPHIKE